MFAVIKAAGKQYKVAVDDKITLSTVAGNAGDHVTFDHVLMVSNDGTAHFGAPTLAGASVAGEIVEQTRGPKSISFKKRRRQNSKRKRGHRQDLTIVQITQILTDGAKASKTTKVVSAASPAAAISASAVSDDVEIIDGIGPTIGKRLKAAGITSWKQVAEWTDADVAKYDAELSLKGRIVNEEWIVQAKELLAGKPPRAKIDQAKVKKD